MRTAIVLGLAYLFQFSVFAGRSSGSTVNVKYDKFEDFTEVSTNLARVDNAVGSKQNKQDLRLQTLYTCRGQTSHCRPDKVEFRFVSYSVAQHIRSHQLILLVDGKRERVTLEPKWTVNYEGTDPLSEHITAFMNVEDFSAIARAKSIEGKLGQTTFQLSDDNLAAIRALADEITSQKSKKGV